MGERKAKWQNDYIARTYDRINLTVPKGRKEEIQAEAERRGQSVNGFINGLIDGALSGIVPAGSPAADDGSGGGSGFSAGSPEENMCSRFTSQWGPDFQTTLSDSGQSPAEFIEQAVRERFEREHKTPIPRWIQERYPGEKWPVLKAVRAIQGDMNAQRSLRASMTPEQWTEWCNEFTSEIREELRQGGGQDTPKRTCNLPLDDF